MKRGEGELKGGLQGMEHSTVHLRGRDPDSFFLPTTKKGVHITAGLNKDQRRETKDPNYIKQKNASGTLGRIWCGKNKAWWLA